MQRTVKRHQERRQMVLTSSEAGLEKEKAQMEKEKAQVCCGSPPAKFLRRIVVLRERGVASVRGGRPERSEDGLVGRLELGS
jgi:hypothetical protein